MHKLTQKILNNMQVDSKQSEGAKQVNELIEFVELVLKQCQLAGMGKSPVSMKQVLMKKGREILNKIQSLEN